MNINLDIEDEMELLRDLREAMRRWSMWENWSAPKPAAPVTSEEIETTRLDMGAESKQ